MDASWAARFFADDDLMAMGHGQSRGDKNLGLGWLYYALVRMYRPRNIVSIGSFRGFVPMMLARGQADNAAGGEPCGMTWFIDPSMVDNQWADPDKVHAYFADFDLTNICHFRATTQDFAASDDFQVLPPIDMLFVDGFHSAEQARFDHETFVPLLADGANVLFHDSSPEEFHSDIYGADKSYRHTVFDYVSDLRKDRRNEVMDFQIDRGVALVRRHKEPL